MKLNIAYIGRVENKNVIKNKKTQMVCESILKNNIWTGRFNKDHLIRYLEQSKKKIPNFLLWYCAVCALPIGPQNNFPPNVQWTACRWRNRILTVNAVVWTWKISNWLVINSYSYFNMTVYHVASNFLLHFTWLPYFIQV